MKPQRRPDLNDRKEECCVITDNRSVGYFRSFSVLLSVLAQELYVGRALAMNSKVAGLIPVAFSLLTFILRGTGCKE